MAWFQDLGFKRNPLGIKPTEDNNLLGYEKMMQRIVYQLKIGNVIFLEGGYGTGKSSILRSIRKTFRDNILYFNCAQQSDLKRKIMESRDIIRKIFFLKPKKMLLLIDEANLANPKDFDFLYEFYIMDRIKSIVFAGTDFKRVPFNKAFKSDTKLYKLNEIRDNIAIEILNMRMPFQELVNPALARMIFNQSEMNPRRYLENLEDLIKSAHALGKKKLTKKDVDSFFPTKEKKTYRTASTITDSSIY
jgi:replication-associated recombination protein RarA